LPITLIKVHRPHHKQRNPQHIRRAVRAEIHKGRKMQGRRLISVKEAAKLLNVSVHTLYSLVSERRIPFVKLGRRTEFDIRDLDTWIEKNKTRQQEF